MGSEGITCTTSRSTTVSRSVTRTWDPKGLLALHQEVQPFREASQEHGIRRDYLHYIKKYNRFEKRHKNMGSEGITCTTSRSTTVSRSVTRTWLSTCRHASEMSSPEMLQLSVNADPSPKLSNSTH